MPSSLVRPLARLLLPSLLGLLGLLSACTRVCSLPEPEPVRHGPDIDATAVRLMTEAKLPGLALAIIEEGQVVAVKAYGLRDVEQAAPLQTDTVMYGASLTKLVFGYLVMQLVDEGVLDLDTPIERYLKKPLPEFKKYEDLAADPRWKQLTPRMLLSHSPGFPNFRFLNPDGKLDFKFDPGARYAYSGEGINLLQFVLEDAGLGLDAGQEFQRRVFDRFGMRRTSMVWRDDFAPNVTTGYDEHGVAKAHHQRGSVRAAGSMDTTIEDYAKFLAGLMRGEGLSSKARAELLSPQLAIPWAHQFPTLTEEKDPRNQAIALSAGLGMVLFDDRSSPAFFKGGHDEHTDNFVLCLERGARCVVLLANSVKGPHVFPPLIEAILGPTDMPWRWDYNPYPPPTVK
ncbi:beta-lactamase family protein [Myxococcus sp. CA056]|uniref:serine hydrolase domain-containing protein n=1 Tax=unclassified Myxococcus TaxID=2648731 RepID=UPI00157A8938|nr:MULTISPECIES: serine hydrolase domain-containing protein [unclassified Myxococcus]NTX10186.1 beta-lactamase family protein [Myxococcus sp. CA056]NTX37612.1 beta-lactamase family protein [Myxococcus sp. CA033]NTX51019.1 beta-lactamase family protein [Myxococcus sp. CA039A]